MVYKTSKIMGIEQSGPPEQGEFLDSLYRLYSRDVVNFIRQRACRLRLDPEDVAQEVFAKLARRGELLEAFKRGSVNRLPYLFSMANNLVADMERKLARQRKYVESVKHDRAVTDDVTAETPESLVLAESDQQTFKAVIKALKPEWREAFLLSRFRHLSYPEVAQVMEVTVKQVENYISQALIKLRQAQAALEESGEWP